MAIIMPVALIAFAALMTILVCQDQPLPKQRLWPARMDVHRSRASSYCQIGQIDLPGWSRLIVRLFRQSTAAFLPHIARRVLACE